MKTPRSGALILWSVPRARSTAFERMMFERQDHLTIHEPFSRVCDFGESQVHLTSCGSQAEVIRAIDTISESLPVFVKDTLDFRFAEVLADADFLSRHRHAVMVRDPREAVTSYLKLDPAGTADTVGFRWLAELAARVEDVTGTYPHVVEAAALMADPAGTVRSYCEAMGIDYLPEALTFRLDPPSSWRTTGRWHDAAASTSRLGTPPVAAEPASGSLSARIDELVALCTPSYDQIRAHAGAHTAEAVN